MTQDVGKGEDSIPGVGSPLRTYTHGLDLSGTPQGAGSIAGLLFATTYNPTSHDREGVVAYCYDGNGNGNVTDLLNLKPGDFSPRGSYEYSPFGQLLRATGAAVDSNPFKFSTKYTDAETGFCFYGYRYYDAAMGRWLNRDPIEEKSFVFHVMKKMIVLRNLSVLYSKPNNSRIEMSYITVINNLLSSCNNNLINNIDMHGLWVVCCSPVQAMGLGQKINALHCQVDPGFTCKGKNSLQYSVWRDFSILRVMRAGPGVVRLPRLDGRGELVDDDASFTAILESVDVSKNLQCCVQTRRDQAHDREGLQPQQGQRSPGCFAGDAQCLEAGDGATRAGRA